MLTLVQDSPGSTALEEQPTGEDVEPGNDEADYDGKSTVILTLNSSAYLILFGVFPGSH